MGIFKKNNSMYTNNTPTDSDYVVPNNNVQNTQPIASNSYSNVARDVSDKFNQEPVKNNNLNLERLANVQIRTVADVSKVDVKLKEGKTVLLDLRDLDNPTTKRVIDIVTGILLTRKGIQRKVRSKVFLVSISENNLTSYANYIESKIG